MQVLGGTDLELRSLGDQARAEACLHDVIGLTGRASWISLLAQSILGVDNCQGNSQQGLPQDTSRKPTTPGTRANGPFPASGGNPT